MLNVMNVFCGCGSVKTVSYQKADKPDYKWLQVTTSDYEWQQLATS